MDVGAAMVVFAVGVWESLAQRFMGWASAAPSTKAPRVHNIDRPFDLTPDELLRIAATTDRAEKGVQAANSENGGVPETPQLIPDLPEDCPTATFWVPPQSAVNDQDDEDDETFQRPRIVWVSHEHFEKIPWDQRAASPKDIAVWRCRLAAETFMKDEPGLAAALLERVDAWRDAPGMRAGKHGWAVYRQLGRLKAAAGRELPNGLEATVLTALSAPFPKEDNALATD